jgi:catechol 2,3-dioxygenase-like lactoylglutathione lyase family enzyme
VSRSEARRHVVMLLAALGAALALAWPHAAGLRPAPVSTVDRVGFTVSDMATSIAFFRDVLDFELQSDVELDGRDVELLHGVFGARVRVVRMRLGLETIELTEFLAPRGRPYPGDTRGNDRWFQHIAIITSDMARAYARLRDHGVPHASTGPQRLPDWNPNAGGIEAYYFRDPDGHFLEVLAFPPGKGEARWQSRDRLFLGIDHTAITVHDTETSLGFYRDGLGLVVAGGSENHGLEQERLNNVFGARLRITTLKAPRGPGIELLEYLAPRDGRPMPSDLQANDLAHWQTTLVTSDAAPVLGDRLGGGLVSPQVVPADPRLGFARGVLLRDPDGHGVRLVEPR